MSLMKNLKRQEIEIFGAKKVVRNKQKEEQSYKEITNKNKRNNLIKKGKNNERN